MQPKKRSPLLYAGAGVILLLLMAAGYFLLSGKVEQNTNGARIPIAVADFTNQTGEAELDGLSGMLITALEQSRRLSVLSRARMFDILGQMGKSHVNRIDEATGREISLQAGVTALVTASIRKLGRKYIIDMKVLDPRGNEYLLTAREDGEGQESILAMIDRLSEKTRQGLKEQTSEIQQSTKKVADVTTTNLEAYQHFFQGEQFINKLKWRDAITEFEKAIALDSTFGLAYFRLGYSLSWNGTPGAEEAINKALQYIDRVPEKEQYMIRAEKADIERDLPKALALYKAGLRKYPDEKEMIYIVGDISFHLAQYDSAIYYLKKVLAMDPRFERAWQHLSWTYREADPAKWLETAPQYLANVPTQGAYINLGAAYEANRHRDMGLETSETTQELFPESIGAVEGIAGNYIMRGEFTAARSELRKLIGSDEPARRREAGYRSLVVLSAYQGQFKQAFTYIDNLIQKNQKEDNRANLAHVYATRAFWLAFGRGDFSGARMAIQTAGTYLDAATMTSYAGLFSACALTGNFDKIFQKAKQETNLFPFRTLIAEGYKQMDAGNYSQAVDAYRAYLDKGVSYEMSHARY
ncbi:MAG: tetratricopeptide repeat protein, partial [Calditrichia bacterium]